MPACTVCRRPLPAPKAPGAAVVCPQCGEANQPDGDEHACPHCGGAVEPGAAACGACGELLGPLDPDAGTATAGVTTGGAFRAALRDWPRYGLKLGGLAILTAVLWMTLFFTQCLAGLAAADAAEVLAQIRGPDAWGWAFAFGYGLAALAALPLNLAMLLGLQRSNLAAARGEWDLPKHRGGASWYSRLFRNRGKRRALACGGLLAFFAVGVGWAGAFLVGTIGWDFFVRGNGWIASYIDWLVGAAAVFPAAAVWTLFWPLPYLILDRPDLRGLRPLRECWRMAAAGWGGHVAVGLASAALVAVAILPWGLLLPMLAPPAGLLTAHAYLRSVR